MGTRSSALVGLAAVLLAAGPGASSATAQLWSAPATLGQDGTSAVGDVDVDPDGTAIVVWAAEGGPVRAAIRPAGATFGSTVTLVPDGGQSAAVALDGRGGALVAWSRNGSLGLAERTAEAPALTQVPAGAGEIAGGPDVAFTGAGQAIVVWTGTDGAVHALSRSLGGATVALPDIAPGPGNGNAHVDAAGGHAVVAWSHVTQTGSQTTTRVRASALEAGGSFGAAEDLATASSERSVTPNHWSGSELTSQRVVVSAGGAADVLFTELHFQGPPGEVALGGKVATRTISGWAPAYTSGIVDGPHLNSGMYVADVAASSAGDALYVEGFKPNALPPMSFSARLRAAGAVGYGEASALHTGTQGEVRAAPLTVGRYLVLMRSGTGLRSRAGSPATGFGDHLVFSGTDATRLLALAGAPSGLAAAAWVTTDGQVHAAVYDDALRPGSLPPTAAPDDVAPVLSRLAVAPRRFTPRRRTRVRWWLSEPASVRLRVDRVRVGFRRAGRCVARRKQTGRVRRCVRFQQVGTLTRVRQAGPTAVRFDRFVRRRALRPGRYRVTALPRDAAGNRGRAKRARFTILRRR